MAVYQGVRVRGSALSARRADDVPPRAAVPSSTDQRQRVRPTGLLMAAIVAATILGLVYLTQTLGSSATSSEIYDLEGQRSELQGDIATGTLLVLEASDRETVRPAARKLKLKPLGAPLVLRAP